MKAKKICQFLQLNKTGRMHREKFPEMITDDDTIAAKMLMHV